MKPYKSGEHPVNYSKDLKVMYISNLATMFEYRNGELLQNLLNMPFNNWKKMDMIMHITEL